MQVAWPSVMKKRTASTSTTSTLTPGELARISGGKQGNDPVIRDAAKSPLYEDAGRSGRSPL
jgi:hypothetical protein